MKPEWKELYNKHFGGTCLIIGNGPSLNAVPRALLEKYPTFGTNRIYRLLAPTYYVCVNPLVLEQFGDEILQVHSCCKFLAAGEGPDILHLRSIGSPLFSYCPYDWIYEGYTVTFVAMELAYFMGFREVGLVGVDHRYTFEGEPNAATMLNGDDPNHFDPEYFKGALWNHPDLKRSEEAYRLAKDAFECDGRNIMNLGPDSALDVFPKGDMGEWL